MKIDLEQTRKLFLLYTDLPMKEGAKWDILCRKAAALIEGRLRENADTAANRDRLSAAAALWAYGEYLLLSAGSSGNAEEIRVGDIAVKNSSGVSAASRREAAEMKECALSEISDLITGEEVAFLAVGEAIQ